MVVEAARQDAGGVGDVAHGGVREAALGEQLARDAEQLVSSVRHQVFLAQACWLLTETTSPVR